MFDIFFFSLYELYVHALLRSEPQLMRVSSMEMMTDLHVHFSLSSFIHPPHVSSLKSCKARCECLRGSSLQRLVSEKLLLTCSFSM